MFRPSKYLVKIILDKAHAYEWSLQGFGMFRLYLSKEVRLHVWSPDHRVPEVDDIHTHPWHFESKVICGSLIDHMFSLDETSHLPSHVQSTIVCGPGGCEVGVKKAVRLTRHSSVRVQSGDTYVHKAHHVHRTEILYPGTITIIRRTFLADTEHANVYYPIENKSWVSAVPRPTTVDEVERMRMLGLARLEEG